MAQAMSIQGKRETARIDVLITLDLMAASIQAIKRTVREQGLAEVAAKKRNV